jgi:DHA2 family multidrug resistance protein
MKWPLIEKLPRANDTSSNYKWLVLLTTMVGTFMAVLDATIVTVALPKLMAAFSSPIYIIEWVLTAYLLIFGIMLPTSGWLAGRFGYKTIFITGLLLFTLGSFLCSISWNIGTLLFFRVLQGGGAGMIMPVGMAIVTRVFPPQQRGMALGFWSISASASVSLGPAIGGYLIDNFSWHMIFDVNVPVGILGIVLSGIVLKQFKIRQVSHFDLLGFLAMSAFLTGLLLALSNGNASWNTGGWTSRFIQISLGCSALGLIIFILTELTTSHPLIDLTLFNTRNFTLTNIVLFIFGIALFGSNFLIPVYLQDALNYTPFQSGMVFLPVGILLGLTSPIAGYTTDRYSARIPVLIGLCLLTYSFYQYRALSLITENSQILLPLFLRGIGMGLLFSPLTTLALQGIDAEKLATASGIINVIRQIGGSFGIAIFGTLQTQRTIFHTLRIGEDLSRYPELLNKLKEGLTVYVSTIALQVPTQIPQQVEAIIIQYAQSKAFVLSVDDIFFLVSIIMATALIPTLLLKSGKR